MTPGGRVCAGAGVRVGVGAVPVGVGFGGVRDAGVSGVPSRAGGQGGVGAVPLAPGGCGRDRRARHPARAERGRDSHPPPRSGRGRTRSTRAGRHERGRGGAARRHGDGRSGTWGLPSARGAQDPPQVPVAGRTVPGLPPGAGVGRADGDACALPGRAGGGDRTGIGHSVSTRAGLTVVPEPARRTVESAPWRAGCRGDRRRNGRPSQRRARGRHGREGRPVRR